MSKPRIGNKSKRITCRKRYKIEKKVKEHNRKVKKQKEKKFTNRFKKGYKDSGVPNKCPFKEEILNKAIQHRDLIEEERKRRRDKQKEAREREREKKRGMGLDKLREEAEKKNNFFQNKQEFLSKEIYNNKKNDNIENSMKLFYKEVKQVIEESDVIIEVLDARDPLGTRCIRVEEEIIKNYSNKKIILLINKIDLVPKENITKWLKYLKNYFPAIPFKASTQQQSNRLKRSKGNLPLLKSSFVPPTTSSSSSSSSSLSFSSSSCLGADLLMKLLNNYCRNLDIKTSITIGLIGLPNTGKSSILNSLKRSKVCNVGSTPGLTKNIQRVQLDKHIRLLDSPGVVALGDHISYERAILTNCIKLEKIENSESAAEIIMKKCNKNQLINLYGISNYQNFDEFIALIAKRYGFLKKGALLDISKASKLIIRDWNFGKINYYTEPPEEERRGGGDGGEVELGVIDSKLLTEMSKGFSIDDLLNDENIIIDGLTKKISSEETILSNNYDNNNKMEGENKEEEDGEDNYEEEMEEEELNDNLKVNIINKKNKNEKNNNKNFNKTFIAKKLQINKEKFKNMKKLKKNKRKEENLANQFDISLKTDNNNYNFNDFFK